MADLLNMIELTDFALAKKTGAHVTLGHYFVYVHDVSALPGSYSAWLVSEDRQLGEDVTFTVAEYTLAPLSARLRSHQLDRRAEELDFDLSVESYQVPFKGRLEIALVDGGRETSRTRSTRRGVSSLT